MYHGLDLGSVEKRVFDQTGVDGAQQGGFMLRVESRCDHFHVEAPQARRRPGFVRRNTDLQTVLRKGTRFQKLGRVKAYASPQRNQQILRRRHTSIGSALRRRLIADYAVPPGSGLELYPSPILNSNFHDIHEDAVRVKR
jgi:hypothetical protein